MTSKVIDKENTSGVFHSAKILAPSVNSRKFDANFQKPNLTTNSNVKANSLVTPKIVDGEIKIHSNPVNKECTAKSLLKQRRALGDVLNTTTRQQSMTVGATPKAQHRGGLGNAVNTPTLNNNCQSAKKPINQKLVMGTSKQDAQHIEPELPPVEKCWTNIDTFNDIFEDGKLSELLLNMKIDSYVPRMPTGSSFMAEEKFHQLEMPSDKELNRQLKKLNKAIKREEKKELCEIGLGIYQDLPTLDSPQILED